MSEPTPHIHHDCIIVWAADPTLRVESYSGVHWSWLPISSMTPSWHPDSRYRVLDHGGKVLAETPPPKRRVRVPETDLPAPVERINDAEYVVRLDVKLRQGKVVEEFAVFDVFLAACVAVGLAFATKEDAQQWADFLNTKWEEVSE